MTVFVCDYFCVLIFDWRSMQTLFRKLRQKVNEIDDVDILVMEPKMSQKNLFSFHQMAPRRGGIAETED